MKLLVYIYQLSEMGAKGRGGKIEIIDPMTELDQILSTQLLNIMEVGLAQRVGSVFPEQKARVQALLNLRI